MPSLKRIVRYSLAVLAICFPGATSAQQPTSSDAYAGLSSEAAKAKFERTMVALRVEQRAAQHTAMNEFVRLAAQTDVDLATRQRLSQVAQGLAQTSDNAMALELVMQARSQMSERMREPFEAITRKLTDREVAYQQCKLDYQPVAGRFLAEQWTKLSLADKRCQLFDYLALADQRPVWLLRKSPINIVDMVPKSALAAINQYATEKSDLIQIAESDLKPWLDATQRVAHAIVDSGEATSEQREAAQAIIEALEAPYGHGLRGVMLCKPGQDMPDELRSSVFDLLQHTTQKLQSLRPVHDRLLRDLSTRLESSQSERLRQLKLEEQMVIDLYLASATHLINPPRVLARRSTRGDYLEDAQLIELQLTNNTLRYRVEFMIDGTTQWIESDRMMTRTDGKRDMRIQLQTPSEGPGKTVDERTDLRSGQLFAFSSAGWKPVVFIDESALGVILRWHGPAEPIEFTAPRRELRIETAQ